MQKKTNKSRYAILGMLIEKPRTGYEIKQIMVKSTSHFWQESDASIYPMLRKLEIEEKVKSYSEKSGKRIRKIFEITPLGKKEFSTWIAIPSEKENRRNELLLKLFFASHTAKEETLNQLKRQFEKFQELNEEYKTIETDIVSQISDQHPQKPYWLMTLRNGIIHVEAELRWLQECIPQLENKQVTDE